MADDLKNQTKELKQISANIKELTSSLKSQFDKLGSRFGKEVSDIMTPEIQQLQNVFTDVYGITKDSASSTLKFFGKGLTDDAKMLIATEKSSDDLDDISETLAGTGAKSKLGKGLKVQNKGLDKLLKTNNKIAKEQLAMNKREERKKRSIFQKIKKNWLFELLETIIGVPLFLIGLALGTAVAFIIKPFQVIAKIFKTAYAVLQGPLILKALKGLGKLFGGIIKFVFSPKTAMLLDKLGGFGRFIFKIFKPLFSFVNMGELSTIGKIFEGLGKGFKTFSKIFTGVFKFLGKILELPFLRFLTRGFLVGFEKIFWPLQILLSAIDFVKGFMKTEGTILDKIKGGIKNVIVEFFKWPLELLGKIWEWIQVKIFGKNPEDIEEGKAAKTLIEGLGKGIDIIFEGWRLLFGLLWEGVKWIGSKISPFIDWVKGASWEQTKQSVVDWLKNIFWLPMKLREWIMKIFDIQEVPEEPTTPEKKSELFGTGKHDLGGGNWVDDWGVVHWGEPKEAPKKSVADMIRENRAAMQAKYEAQVAAQQAQDNKDKELLKEYQKVGDAIQKSSDKEIIPIATPGESTGKIPTDNADLQTQGLAWTAASLF